MDANDMAVGMSLIYSRNNRGPSIEPCGTPEVTGRKSELSPSITTLWVLSDKYD
jgi:hypothetical protein